MAWTSNSLFTAPSSLRIPRRHWSFIAPPHHFPVLVCPVGSVHISSEEPRYGALLGWQGPGTWSVAPISSYYSYPSLTLLPFAYRPASICCRRSLSIAEDLCVPFLRQIRLYQARLREEATCRY